MKLSYVKQRKNEKIKNVLRSLRPEKVIKRIKQTNRKRMKNVIPSYLYRLIVAGTKMAEDGGLRSDEALKARKTAGAGGTDFYGDDGSGTLAFLGLYGLYNE